MRHPGKQAHHESSVCLQDCEIAAPYDNQATEAMMASPRVVPANAGIHTACRIDLNDGAEAFRNNQRQGLWAPAFARATYERYLNKIRENDGSAHGRGRRRGDRPPRSPR